MEREKVIFRKWKGRDEFAGDGVIALFPRIASTVCKPWCCLSYERVGQHGAADPNIVIQKTRLASPEERKELVKELRRIGYKMQIAKRFTRADYEERKKQMNWPPVHIAN